MNTFVFAILWSVFSFCCSVQLPATFKTCRRSQPEYSKCLGAAIEDALKQLKTPFPEIGLPSFDPLVVTELTLPVHHKNINLDQRIHKLTINGFSHTKVAHTGVDFDAKTIHFDTTVANQTSKTEFEWVGTIAGEATSVKAVGSGISKSAHLNITATFEEYEQNGDKYIKIVEFLSHWVAEDLQYSVESADKKEADHVNKILHDHFREIFGEAEHDFDKLLGNIFLHLANEVFSRVPVKYIFLD